MYQRLKGTRCKNKLTPDDLKIDITVGECAIDLITSEMAMSGKFSNYYRYLLIDELGTQAQNSRTNRCLERRYQLRSLDHGPGIHHAPHCDEGGDSLSACLDRRMSSAFRVSELSEFSEVLISIATQQTISMKTCARESHRCTQPDR